MRRDIECSSAPARCLRMRWADSIGLKYSSSIISISLRFTKVSTQSKYAAPTTDECDLDQVCMSIAYIRAPIIVVAASRQTFVIVDDPAVHDNPAACATGHRFGDTIYIPAGRVYFDVCLEVEHRVTCMGKVEKNSK